MIRIARTPRIPFGRRPAGAALALVATFTLAVVAPAPANAQAQKPAVDHDAYAEWFSIDDDAISSDGRWLVYVREPNEPGDAELRVVDLESDDERVIARGESPELSDDSRFVVFWIRAAHEAVRQAEIEGARGDDQPQDTLGILDLASGEIVRIQRVDNFELPEDGGRWLAYRLERDAEDDDAEDADEPDRGEPTEEDDGPDRDKATGTTLVLRDLASGEERRFDSVVDYAFTENGERLVYIASTDSGNGDGVYVVGTGNGDVSPVLTGAGEYERLTLSDDGDQLAFATNRDEWQSDAEIPTFALYRWTAGMGTAQRVAAAGTDGVPADWAPSENGGISFSDSGNRLFFGTAPIPEPEPEDTLPDDEQVSPLDVWHWQDPELQPRQVLQADNERNRTYMAVVHMDDGDRIVQLETEDLPDIDVGSNGDADVAVGSTDLPYRLMASWDRQNYSDSYLVDVNTGERRQIMRRSRAEPDLSPESRFLTWYDPEDRAWFAMSVESGEVVNLTGDIEHEVHNVLHDQPSLPNDYGDAGWTEDDREFLVYDRYDIWATDPTGQLPPANITEGVGRRDNLTFRIEQLDSDADAIDRDEPLLLETFDNTTKATGFYRDRVDGTRPPERLLMSDHRYGSPDLAEDADRIVLTRESFEEFPDLWVGGTDFDDLRRVTNVNPQQANYRWGTAELVSWRSVDGEPLEGILYKPEGFDPSQQYPMMVYFYERSSDGLHRYRTISPGGSSIGISFYVSRGYVVFVPDIVYRVGYPGESAMQSVVPGVLSVVDEGYVDPDRIGVQGHSWGGYQIAYMVTKTDVFAAAEAGAPVSNMTSAYGGIRWSSGLVRQFQYERTQSRLGGSLWDVPIRYFENSPLFWADKVNTPLLMMHNDEDGAVPWYQGIEFFVALRRLSRPAWMLNYNGQDHGLRRYADRKDWQIRMQQFFDHYLKDAPPPVWLAEGIPATQKGRTLGLELVEPSATTAADGGGDGSDGNDGSR